MGGSHRIIRHGLPGDAELPRDLSYALPLAHSPSVMTLFRRFLGAQGSERATAAVDARRHVHAAWGRTQKPRRGR